MNAVSDKPKPVAATSLLPVPRRDKRWQPLRSGILNLYRYDYEEFHYEDGRLLLRGNNGSGKSRVLAMQLPFLLDGEVTPARVEPDGDAAKRIEWNLLMGRHAERTGYTWIEFGILDANGAAQYLTLGCGMRAVAGTTGLHSRWFFITSQRIGEDLFLQNAHSIPLGKDRLAEAIGTAGRIFQKAEEYRRAVDQKLFGLGARYDALISLLLRLRRPQLTRKLDESELPNALSDALPTLPPNIIDEVAESFRSLQADKELLRDFAEARTAVASFLREYTAYVRIAVRRRTAAVRSANSAYERAQREAREAASAFERATVRLEELLQAHGELERQFTAADATERALAESPEMRTADEIRLAETAASKASKAFENAQADEKQAAKRLQEAQSRQRQNEEQFTSFNEKLESRLRQATFAATAAAHTDIHREHVPQGAVLDWLEPWHHAAQTALQAGVRRRREAIAHLEKQEVHASELAVKLSAAESVLRQALDMVSLAREAEHMAKMNLAQEGAARCAAYVAWRSSLIHLQPAEFDDAMAGDWDAWMEIRGNKSPLFSAIEAARDNAIAGLSLREAAFIQVIEGLRGRIQEYDKQIADLDLGMVLSPPIPSTRRADRAGRGGAPLWRICDFRPEVSESHRANFEAALNASGLLDAWLLPDGQLINSDTEDTFFAASSNGRSSGDEALESTLHAILFPSIDAEDAGAVQLTLDRIEGILRQIGCTASDRLHWVAADGTWQIGPLKGCHTKPTAEYIGESTRAATRHRQLEMLRHQRAATEAESRAFQVQLAGLAVLREEAQDEFRSAPGDEAVIRMGYNLEVAGTNLSGAMETAERAETGASACRDQHATAKLDLERTATDLKLGDWLGRLNDLSDLTNKYENHLAGLWPLIDHWESIAVQLAQSREQRTGAEAEHSRIFQRRVAADNDAEAARARFYVLQETHGHAIADILAQHAEAKHQVARIKQESQANLNERVAQSAEKARADATKTKAEQDRVANEADRRAAIDALRHLAAQRLLAEADKSLADIAEEEWSPTHAMEIVRRIDALLSTSADDVTAWKRYQDNIHAYIQELRDKLVAHGHQPETHQEDDIILVRCLFQARAHTMTELHAAFTGELDERERLLQAREREIIENHLLAEVAVEIQKLIREAEAWRGAANTELYDHPTSTGVRFRFQWEPDTETRFHEIRPILLRKGELWTPEQRNSVASFLQERIAEQQVSDETGSWRDHLSRALDYRRWHHFVIERQQDDKWKRLNKSTYGTGSGGEKALALTLPRFAAAAAHYRSAAGTAPRLVMLDEAFAGIDPTMRAECMDVLTQFDLDVVMTSELEWGTYPTVPALGIYHLTTLPGYEAVAATRWVWNGREKRQEDQPKPQTTPPAAPHD